MSCRFTALLPPPLSPASLRVCLRVRGWGNPNSDDWRKSLALCLYMDKTVKRGCREMGGARKQKVLHTVQLESRICTARENGCPEWRLRACWLCTFLAGGGRVRACGEGSCRFPPPPRKTQFLVGRSAAVYLSHTGGICS